MMVIPFTLPGVTPKGRGPVVVVCVLEKGNLDRMRKADPFDMQFSAFQGSIPLDRPIRQLDLVIAYEEDVDALMQFKERNDIVGLLKWLERGRKIQPGDTLPPVSLGAKRSD